MSTYAYNNFEGNRFRLGFRTTPEISKNWLSQAYVALDTKHTRINYGAQVSRILERRHWTVASAEFRHDVEQIALLDNDFLPANNLFVAASRFGRFTEAGRYCAICRCCRCNATCSTASPKPSICGTSGLCRCTILPS